MIIARFYMLKWKTRTFSAGCIEIKKMSWWALEEASTVSLLGLRVRVASRAAGWSLKYWYVSVFVP